MTEVALVIPTLNAERYLGRLLPAIAAQTLKPASVVVIDSSSKDRTAAICRQFGATVSIIPQDEFDHGGTRQQGLALAGPCEVAIFLTQDAIPAHLNAFEFLVRPFADAKVGMAYGRQLPHGDANPFATHARLFNYPGQSECISLSDAPQRGFRSTFASDSFAAYRVSALYSVGGFPTKVLFGEDMILAARLLKAGWAKAYVAESAVYHSHNYSIADEFKRYFDIGAVHAQQRALLAFFGDVGGAGWRFVRSEVAYLWREAPWLIPSAALRVLAKFVGYKLGRGERHIPIGWKCAFSMNGWFWGKKSL